MTNAKLAKMLRSAASGLEKGRRAAAIQKIIAAASYFEANARIEILQWRTYGADDDSVEIALIPGDEQEANLLKETLAEEDHTSALIAAPRRPLKTSIASGKIFQRGNRKFRVLITEEL